MNLSSTINLVYPDKGNIKYKISRFPDGQQNIVIEKDTLNKYKWCNILTRINNWRDLELLVCTIASLRELEVDIIYLYCPYILGSRSDRKFEDGGNNYLKQVICPIINSLNFTSVTVVDPHSDVLEACLNNFKKLDNIDLVKFAMGEIYDYDSKYGNDNSILVSPDAGASKKIYKIAEEIEHENIIICSKNRDENGKLTRCVVPIKSSYNDKDFVIIDDICDGGATFINIAKEIKNDGLIHPFSGKIYLIVTHGIFSKGFAELQRYFDGIYCTNSYQDFPKAGFTDREGVIIQEGFIKQYNVFE